MTIEPGDQADPQQSRRISIWLVVAGIILVAVAIFIGQNGEDVSVSFLWFSGDLPLWLLIVVALIAGAILGQVGLYLRRRRKQRDDSA